MMWLLICVRLAFADGQIWMKGAYRQKVMPKTQMKFTQHLRLNDNGAAVESVIPEIEVFRKLNSWADVGLGYRYFWRQRNKGGLEPAHRVHVDVDFEGAVSKQIDVSYRWRIQRRREFDETEGSVTNRHRTMIEFDAPKGFRPLAFVEYHIADDAQDKFQLGLGLKYKRNKRERLSFRLMQERFVNTTPSNHIAMLGYEYRFRKKKKKSKKKG